MAVIKKFPIFRLLSSMSGKNVISAFDSIISEYDNEEKIISGNGNRRYKTTLPVVTKAPYNSTAVFSRGRNILGMMPMPKSCHHSYPSSQQAYTRYPMSAHGNQP